MLCLYMGNDLPNTCEAVRLGTEAAPERPEEETKDNLSLDLERSELCRALQF